MDYSYHHPNTEVRHNGQKGTGLFAKDRIGSGEVVVITGGRILSFESLRSHEMPGHPFQVELNWVIAPFDLKRLDGIFVVNHSCAPNTGIRGQTSLVALREISAGEEICYDYTMTDSDLSGQETFSMDCLCGTPKCRKRISDLDWRRKDLQVRYRGYFSSYLQERIAEQV